MAEPLYVLLLDSTHAGSKYALAPPTWELGEGAMYSANQTQLYLWEKWNEMWDALPPRLNAVIHLGDVIEGEDRRNAGIEQFLTHPSKQKNLAIDILEPVRDRADEFYMIYGTPYHDSKASQAVREIAEALNATPHPNKELATWHMKWSIGGVDFDLAHHTSTPVVYRGTPMEREGLFAALAHRERGNHLIVGRGHNHYCEILSHRNTDLIAVPCWQAQTPYMITKSPNRMIPNIGAVLVTIDYDDPWGTPRITQILFPHPKADWGYYEGEGEPERLGLAAKLRGVIRGKS